MIDERRIEGGGKRGKGVGGEDMKTQLLSEQPLFHHQQNHSSAKRVENLAMRDAQSPVIGDVRVRREGRRKEVGMRGRRGGWQQKIRRHDCCPKQPLFHHQQNLQLCQIG